MKYIFTFLLISTHLLLSNPVDNAYSWISQEYKDFRTYPRVNKAQMLVKQGKILEARELIEKALEIDVQNQKAINLLLHICIQTKDSLCIDQYASKAKGVGLGYFYKHKADEANEQQQYRKAIKFSKKALKYRLKEDDRYFLKLILFESYLKSKQHQRADKLITKDDTSIYQLFKWSKIAENLNETNYAYELAKELPNKLEYIRWKRDLLIKSKRYKEASKKLEILSDIEPTQKNKTQLLHLYNVTHQDENIVNTYKEKLKKGCHQYALEYLLNYYKKDKHKKRALLEKHYPYKCLKKKKQIQLSLELIKLLKKNKPKKAKKIALNTSKKITNQKDLINLYQSTNQKGKLLQLYKKKLSYKCDEYALYYLLDHYKKDKKIRENILEKNYPYSCLSEKKRNKLSLELITLIGDKNVEKTENIVKHLNGKSLNSTSYLYLSNLESSLENYEKSIEYATAYLQKYPNNIEALKNIGYSYFKLNKKSSAIHYLLNASKLDPNDSKLLKNIGYLCIDLEQYQTASYYWTLYLKKKEDSDVRLKLASLYYYQLNKKVKSEKVLKKYSSSDKNKKSEYYLLKAKLAHQKQNCKQAVKYYKKALKITQKEYIEYEYIHLLQQCKQEDKALIVMQKFSTEHPHNLQYQKELAYMYEKKKKYNQAIEKFKKIKNKEPEKVKNHTSLAYNYKKNGQTQKAVDAFKEALDKSKNMNHLERRLIKEEISNGSKIFHFYLAQSVRLNAYKEGRNISPVNSAVYNGFGSMQLSVQPNFLPKSTTLYANITHGHKNIKQSIQPSVGIRYKPIKNKEVYLSAEQLIKTGKSTRNDTLLRASLGISGNNNSKKIHQELYLESVLLAKKQSAILYGNYELGKIYKINNKIKVTPYLTTGGTYSNDNYQKKAVSKLDVGVGIAVDINADETHYEINKYKNRLKLEARQKYAGNSKDKQALRLQWEFFY